MEVNQDKLLEGKREVKKNIGFFRCMACGHDKERLYPQVYNVGPEAKKIIEEIAGKDSNFRIVSAAPANPKIFMRVDDITLRPIKGICYNINIDVCHNCIDKVGWRHKFLDKYKSRLYADTPL